MMLEKMPRTRAEARGGAPHANKHGKEGGIHGTNVRRTGGKHVVGVEVEEHDHEESRLPRKAGSGHDLHNCRGEPGNETVLVKVGSHGDESCEPGEGIPGRSFSEALFPCDDTGNEQGGEANHGGDSADTKLRAEDPKGDGDREGSSHDLLVRCHGAELFELLLSLDRSLGRVLHLGRVQDVQDERHGDEADEAGHGCSESPDHWPQVMVWPIAAAARFTDRGLAAIAVINMPEVMVEVWKTVVMT